MGTRDERDEKWQAFEKEMVDMLEEARKRYLLADDFQEMEQMTLALGQQMQQKMLEAATQQREVDAPPNCPECGDRMHKKGKSTRKMKTSVGEVEVERERWQCPTCGQGLFPPR